MMNDEVKWNEIKINEYNNKEINKKNTKDIRSVTLIVKKRKENGSMCN